MVIIGVDSHKRTHTAVAVDGNGRVLAERTVAATGAGHLELLRWAARFVERDWALEDCRSLSRRLGADLLRAGERVRRVPPKLMAGARRMARQPGKSDPIDATAVARAALREPNLPLVWLDGPERELRLLTDHRDDLVAERTRAVNRLRWHLHELMPGAEPAPRSHNRRAVQAELARHLAALDGTLARLAREQLARVAELSTAIASLERELAGLVAPLAPTVLAIEGCATLTAAKVLGEIGRASRFRSAACFARHTAAAPIPVWSGNLTRHRLNPGGNRQLNACLHRIAITQLRMDGRGRAYFAKRTAAGDTRREAIRALKRRISDALYRALLHDERDRDAAGEASPRAA